MPYTTLIHQFILFSSIFKKHISYQQKKQHVVNDENFLLALGRMDLYF